MINSIITPTSISLIIDNVHRVIDDTHCHFYAVKDALVRYGEATTVYDEQEILDEIRDLVDIRTFIARVTEGRVEVSDNEVRFDGVPVKGVIAERLIHIIREGLDVRPLARFLERVSQNPILTARDEIYLFMESGNMPITDDGCFLAFKKVKSDYSSSHPGPDGKPFYNHIGTIVNMPVEECDTDRNSTCSRGLHFCSFQYLPDFGLGEESRVVIVKVAPEDVVAIPYDYNNSKGRAWRYAIVGEVPEAECKHLFEDKPVVSTFQFMDLAEDVHDNTQEMKDWAWSEYKAECECVDHCELDTCWTSAIPANATELKYWGDLTFTHNDMTYTGLDVHHYVDAFGQRGFARATGVPRTTIQGWLSKMVAHGYPD